MTHERIDLSLRHCAVQAEKKLWAGGTLALAGKAMPKADYTYRRHYVASPVGAPTSD